MKKILLIAVTVFTLAMAFQSCKSAAPCPAYPGESQVITEGSVNKA